jgi:hypothetical protein
MIDPFLVPTQTRLKSRVILAKVMQEACNLRGAPYAEAMTVGF